MRHRPAPPTVIHGLSRTIRQRWFKIGLNMAMIFVGLELIEYAFATQYYFSGHRLQQDLPVLEAMYIAFIAGLFPNYATTIADAFIGINLSSFREMSAVFLFLIVTFMLNAAVIYVSLAWI
ncbi:MAG: hypothetical protein RIB84_25010 [Sneathiellaceae bacterium]